MRRDTLTLQARYVYSGGRAADPGRLPDDPARADRLGGPGDERRGDLDLGNVAIVPGFVNAHTHLELAPLGRPGDRPAIRRTRCRGCGGSSTSGGRAPSNHSARPSRETSKPSIEAGTTFLADTTTAGLSWGPIAEAPLRAVVFAELIGLQARPRPRDQRCGLEMAGLDPPRDAGGRLRAARPEPARALQHVGLALSQGGRQPDAALDPPGRDARGAAVAQAPRRAAAALPRRPRRLGRRMGADRPTAGRLRPPRRAAQRRLADRPRHLPRSRRLLAASPRGRPRRPPRGRRLLPANPCPVRPRPSSLSRAAGTRRDRLPRHRQPGVLREPRASSTRSGSSTAATSRSRAALC